jgi:hypothetical protein
MIEKDQGKKTGESRLQQTPDPDYNQRVYYSSRAPVF